MIGLPPFPEHEAAWGALVDVLRGDPMLRSVVRSWRVWDGNAEVAAPPPEAAMPWVRLTPSAAPMEWSESWTYEAPLIVTVETLLAGSDVRDAFRFAHAIFRAVHPMDADRRRAVEGIWEAAGVLGPTWIQLPYGARDFGPAAGLKLYGAGSLRLDCTVTTDPRYH
jgi:hypothetical protein